MKLKKMTTVRSCKRTNMRYTDFRNIKRGIFLLVLTGVSLAYIQLVALEQWGKFVHLNVQISRTIHYNSGKGKNLLRNEKSSDVLYFEYNETDLMKKQVDYSNPIADTNNSADNDVVDFRESTDFNEKAGNRNQSKIKSSKKHARRNLYATINLEKIISDETNFTKKPLMVLFSSWVSSPEKAKVQGVVKRLWNSWSSIKPAVVTTDTQVQNECTLAGWGSQNVTSVDPGCHGPPVLAKMFTDVSKAHDAYFYGFSNADIIFGDGLEKTMKFLYYHYSPWKTKPVLVVGRRHNVDFIEHANFTLDTPTDVGKMAEKGTLVVRSTDYFFSNELFPWARAPKVSIGRPYVVRAIIGWALQRRFDVIDATKTIESVHLTTQDGVFASWHKKGTMCNERVMAKLRWNIPLSFGHCECARLETFKGVNKTIEMRHRPMSRRFCGR
jgi:hypothetical protein